MTEIEALLEGGRHVILGGPAGLGKTRLASEIAAAMSARRVTVQRVVASPASSPVPLAVSARPVQSDLLLVASPLLSSTFRWNHRADLERSPARTAPRTAKTSTRRQLLAEDAVTPTPPMFAIPKHWPR